MKTFSRGQHDFINADSTVLLRIRAQGNGRSYLVQELNVSYNHTGRILAALCDNKG